MPYPHFLVFTREGARPSEFFFYFFVGFDLWFHSTRMVWAMICRFARAFVVCNFDRVALSHEGAWTFVISLWYLGSFLWFCFIASRSFPFLVVSDFKCKFQVRRWTRTKPGVGNTRRPAGKLLNPRDSALLIRVLVPLGLVSTRVLEFDLTFYGGSVHYISPCWACVLSSCFIVFTL